MKIKKLCLEEVSDYRLFRNISWTIKLQEDFILMLVFLQVNSPENGWITLCQNLARIPALSDWRHYVLKCHILLEMQSQTKIQVSSCHYRTLQSQQKIQPGLQRCGQNPSFATTLWQCKLFFRFHRL